MPIADSEIQETAAIQPFLPFLPLFIRDCGDQRVQLLDGLEHSFPKDGMPETLFIESGGIRVVAHTVEDIQEERKSPFAIRAPAHAAEPAFLQPHGEAALDVLPGADVAVVHPHQAVAVEWMAVGVGEGALGGGAHVGEDELRGGFGAEPVQVDAIPGGYGGGEDAGGGTEGWGGVVAESEAIAVVWAAAVLNDCC